ncbi:DUF4102 domain-containing protein [Candidatus Magnetaquicoccus inordinatus]|uniref:DUF4102 domain-containing protein n=1 Tax=Candidatus Magnetaquicoccus inordinatus TaxID=2496818 RepID=UPI00102CB031|nr:DUF4102 domain-containing protein [Candidatus Magnetaquicoccus inordinatus]
MAQAKITKKIVDAITPGETDQFFWDVALKGFVLKVTAAGKIVYVIQYRHSNRLRRYVGKRVLPLLAFPEYGQRYAHWQG